MCYSRERRHFDFLMVDYRRALEQPSEVVTEINAFLGGQLDEAAMAAVVDPALYRNRA